MNPQTFFEHFERLTDAPNAVARLRELILQLAVQGKLIEQGERDEPAVHLLERIEAERKQLVREKKIKEAKRPLPVNHDEMPFTLPSGWTWVRLGELTQVSEYGTSQKASEINEGVPVLRMNNIVGGNITFDNLKYLPATIDELPRLYLKYNDLLFNRTNSYELVGKTGIFKGEDNTVTFASYLIRLTLFLNHVDADFINLVMNSAYYRQTQIEPEITQQTNQANFNGTKLANTFLPLPPLEEQKRIVAKVDELMRLCDELERMQAERREARQRLNRAALDGLLAARDTAEFQARWQTITDNFPTLTAAPDQIGKLRQTVLQLAVQGKLTRQDPQDEPAASLLRRIRAEKEHLHEEKGLKRIDSLPPVNRNEAPFMLPDGWTWVRFPELGEFGRGKSKHRPRNDPSLFHEGKYPLVQTGDVARANGVVTTHTGLYNERGLSQSRMWSAGTMCITIAANIADVAILGFDACFPDSVVGFVPSREIGSAEFFLYFIQTAKSQLEDFAPSTAQKNINLNILERLLIPLPPLEEQKRIVTAVNRLMALCDELEAGLHRAEEGGERLLRAAVHSLLSPITQNSMRVPALA